MLWARLCRSGCRGGSRAMYIPYARKGFSGLERMSLGCWNAPRGFHSRPGVAVGEGRVGSRWGKGAPIRRWGRVVPGSR